MFISSQTFAFPKEFSSSFISWLEKNDSDRKIASALDENLEFLEIFTNWVGTHSDWIVSHYTLIHRVIQLLEVRRYGEDDVIAKINALAKVSILGLVDKSREKKIYLEANEEGTPFLFICEHGSVEDVIAFIANCPESLRKNLFKRSEYNTTPLHYAAKAGKADIIRILLENCLDENCKDMLFQPNQLGNTPLHFAAQQENPEVVEIILKECPKEIRNLLFKPNKYGLNPFDYAITKNLNMAKMIFEKFPEPIKNECFLPDQEGNTCLHEVAIRGNVEALHFVINSCPVLDRAILFKENKTGSTPLVLAVTFNNLEIIPSLLSSCPKPIKKALFSINTGDTPLHVAASKGNLEAIQVIKENCPEEFKIALITAKNSIGNTCLTNAIYNDHPEVIYALSTFCHSAPDCLFIKDDLGTPLHRAILKENPELVQAVLAICPESLKESLFFAKNERNRTPLSLAAAIGNSKATRAIIEAYPNEENKHLLFDQILFKKADISSLPVLFEWMPVLAIPNAVQFIAECLDESDFTKVKQCLSLCIESPRRDEFLAELFKYSLLTKYLIEQHEEIVQEFMKRFDGESNLPRDVQLSLLPFLSPRLILEVISTLSKDEGMELLQRKVTVEQNVSLVMEDNGNLSALGQTADLPSLKLPLKDALKLVKEKRVDLIPWHLGVGSNLMQQEVKRFLNELPLQALAYAVTEPDLQDIVLAYVKLFSDLQMRVIVPQLSHVKFIALLKHLAEIPQQIIILSCATLKQKIAFLDAYDLARLHLFDWEEKHEIFKQELQGIFSHHEDDKIKALQEQVDNYGKRFNLLAQLKYQIKQIAKAIKEKDIEERVEAKKLEALERLDRIQKEFISLRNHVFEIKLSTADEEMPEEFMDPITALSMVDPVTIKKLPELTVDRSTLQILNFIHPLTRATFTEADIEPNTKLCKAIKDWHKNQENKPE